MKTAMEKKLARALRARVNYTGGSDAPNTHPCARAYAALADYNASGKRATREPESAVDALRKITAAAKMRTSYGGFAYCISDAVMESARAAIAEHDEAKGEKAQASAAVAELIKLGWDLEEWLEGIEDEDSRAPCILRNNFRASLVAVKEGR